MTSPGILPDAVLKSTKINYELRNFLGTISHDLIKRDGGGGGYIQTVSRGVDRNIDQVVAIFGRETA